jgi:hypothetical protein
LPLDAFHLIGRRRLGDVLDDGRRTTPSRRQQRDEQEGCQLVRAIQAAHDRRMRFRSTTTSQRGRAGRDTDALAVVDTLFNALV